MMNLKITQELFEAYRAGDTDVGNQIYEFSYARIKRYVNKLVKSDDNASEIAQEVMIEFWEKRESLKSPETFFGYLFTIARNKTFQYFREQSKNIILPLSYITDKQTAPDEMLAFDEQSNYIALEDDLLLERSLSIMSEQKRRIFILHRMEGYSVKEISNRMNLSERTVENQIYRAVKELKNILLLLCLIVHI